MFNSITPEQAGISSSKILEVMKILDEYSPCTHSIIIAKGNDIFYECYYAPFNKDFKHRMYSVSKTFVSVAIGLLVEDGLLSLDDKLLDYFPEYSNEGNSELLKRLTIKDMLTMSTASSQHPDWFYTGTNDRTEVYFKATSDKIPGTVFDYDSPGSYMLNVIVEKITKKPFLKFLQERFLDDIGFSKDAYCIKAPGGYSFGDSGVMCSARDLLTFARFVMNKGIWNGKRYMNSDYLTQAVTKQVDNNISGFTNFDDCGYGYQVWITSQINDRFSFCGMGGQFAICDPVKDLIFVINADNQGNASANQMLHYAVFHHIFDVISDEKLPENTVAYNELMEYTKSRKLFALSGNTKSDYLSIINDVTYILEKNPMNIEKLRFEFESDTKGVLVYKNLTGEKKLRFGIGYNEFCKFPQEGYSDLIATVQEKNHYYDCACSAVWAEPQKLILKVQIIDKYFGNATFVFSFKDNEITVSMRKFAEAFLDEYNGNAIGKRL